MESARFVHHKHVDVNGESERPQDRGNGREPGKKRLCRAESVYSVAVVTTAVSYVPVKVHYHTDEIGTRDSEICERQMNEDLARFCPYARNADVGEDDESGSGHGEKGNYSHHRSQPIILVFKMVVVDQRDCGGV